MRVSPPEDSLDRGLHSTRSDAPRLESNSRCRLRVRPAKELDLLLLWHRRRCLPIGSMRRRSMRERQVVSEAAPVLDLSAPFFTGNGFPDTAPLNYAVAWVDSAIRSRLTGIACPCSDSVPTTCAAANWLHAPRPSVSMNSNLSTTNTTSSAFPVRTRLYRCRFFVGARSFSDLVRGVQTSAAEEPTE